MTTLPRIWAALTISVLAGVTAGCASPAAAPIAGAKSTTSTQGTTKAPVIAEKLAYCAPLLVADAFEATLPSDKAPEGAASKKLGKLLVPVVAAAKADGKADVAALLGLRVKISDDPKHMTQKERTSIRDGIMKVGPVILKDCGVNMMS